ncbi:MAG: response regulator [Hyphomonadaceae bacterium]|jgi:DNA-binding response OmpR family regulator
MSSQNTQSTFLLADSDQHSRNLLAEVLRAAGYFMIDTVRNGNELLERTCDTHPRIVITASRIPGLSGLQYTRMIRAGYKEVSRQTSIIVMTDTPTKGFLAAAQQSGADEMLVRPFSSQAVLLRVKSVLERPREFVDCAVYVGPCRRRRMVEQYVGPMRRFIDPIGTEGAASPWEHEENRVAVRSCVKKISELSSGLTAMDRRKLREIFFAVKETQQKADEVRDEMMGEAARSLGRYIMAIGANGTADPEVLTTHIDAMHTLGVLTGEHHLERENLIAGLKKVVDKRLGRTQAA